MKVRCELCKKELKGSFIWVSCDFFKYHPISECGGCAYPVGLSCANKVTKEFKGEKTTVNDWKEELKI